MIQKIGLTKYSTKNRATCFGRTVTFQEVASEHSLQLIENSSKSGRLRINVNGLFACLLCFFIRQHITERHQPTVGFDQLLQSSPLHADAAQTSFHGLNPAVTDRTSGE
jgi:hypothetical protein